MATLSTGVVFPNPKHYKAHLAKLKRLSRVLARKVKSSGNRYKAKVQLAKHHATKIANLRKNTLHQITTYLCKNHATIVVEDLNVDGMLKNHKLAQVIADCGFHEFKRQLEYKAKKFGCEIIVANRWFPSSKTIVKLWKYPRYATKRKNLQLRKLWSFHGQRFECSD